MLVLDHAKKQSANTKQQS